MKYLKILFILLSAMIYANEIPSECDFITLQIINNSEQQCDLSHNDIISGKIVSSLPTSIKPYNNKAINLQDDNGIDLNLAYSCGENLINFSIKRAPVIFSAQEISIESFISGNSKVLINQYSGSCWWGNRAEITIQII
jgi:hypothetical protein